MPINDDPRTQAKRQNDADDRKVDNPLANFDGSLALMRFGLSASGVTPVNCTGSLIREFSAEFPRPTLTTGERTREGLSQPQTVPLISARANPARAP